MKIGSLAVLVIVSASNIALASSSETVYEGCYTVKSGIVETLATTLFTDGNGLLRQQGEFSVNLKNVSKDLPDDVLKKLKIKRGTVVGELAGFVPDTDPPAPILLHTLINDDRSGIIVSDTGVLTSSNQTTECVLEVTELLKDFTGFGVYDGLDYEASFIIVEGELNVCNGQNTFDVTDGELCFF